MCPQPIRQTNQEISTTQQNQQRETVNDLQPPAVPRIKQNPAERGEPLPLASSRWPVGEQLSYIQLHQHLGNWQGNGMPPAAFCQAVSQNRGATLQLLNQLSRELRNPTNERAMAEHLQMYAAINIALSNRTGNQAPQVVPYNPRQTLQYGVIEPFDPGATLAAERARASQMTAVPRPVETSETQQEPAIPPGHAGWPRPR